MEPTTQENRELNLVGRFDFFTVQNGPQRGAVILRLLGFGVVRIVGIDPDEAQVVATLALARDQGKGVARLRAYK